MHVDLEEIFEDEVGWGEISPQLRDIIVDVPLWVPDDVDHKGNEGMKVVYDRALAGRCMTCNGLLGVDTMLTVVRAGIVMIHCGGACYTDQQVLGYLEEQYSDMVEKIKFRGAQGDEGEDEPETE